MTAPSAAMRRELAVLLCRRECPAVCADGCAPGSRMFELADQIIALPARHAPPADAAQMREALQQIAEAHVPDQPMASALPEAVYVREHVANLRRIAQRALSAGAAPRDVIATHRRRADRACGEL
jgi:hypothetical protein